MKTQIERFTEKVQINTGCWIWTGCILKNGYGQGSWDGKREYAHRIAYQIYKGEIQEGLTIDHLCRVTSCVNPGHLEAVTIKVNIRRAHKHRENTRRGAGRCDEAGCTNARGAQIRKGVEYYWKSCGVHRYKHYSMASKNSV